MGLDMYLERDIYIGSPDMRKHNFENPEKIRITVPHCIPKQIKSITEEVCYWRKCNAIHAWFVKNVQDDKDECERTWVKPEQIIELHDLCKELLVNKDESEVFEKLPPCEGFFFGGTDINEWFWKDLEMTVKMLKPHLALIKEGELKREAKEKYPWIDYYYHSSW
jgi:hypothetical protein